MDGKNIPPIITLSAGMIACVFCILKDASLYTTLKLVLLVMVIFYVIGRIAQKILVKIDNDAEEALLERQRLEQEQAARELAEAELAKQAEEQAAKEAAEKEMAEQETAMHNFVKEMFQEN